MSQTAEIGVYKGNFAEKILKSCPLIKRYYMVDPWRNLPDWNKPANTDNATFETYYKKTLTKRNLQKIKE